jgi:cob(I)alamin adenosyltransferase
MSKRDELKSTGLIQVYTGNGKGKTTAALGTALRAVSQGMKVAIVHFDKGGEHYSERALIAARLPEIELHASGLDRIDPITNRFRFGVTPEDKAEAERGLAIVHDIFARAATPREGPALVILDEINTTVTLGMLAEPDVLAVIKTKPAHVELILTGRTAPDSFKELADLVSDVNLVKHYFYHGVPARYGIDY